MVRSFCQTTELRPQAKRHRSDQHRFWLLKPQETGGVWSAAERRSKGITHQETGRGQGHASEWVSPSRSFMASGWPLNKPPYFVFFNKNPAPIPVLLFTWRLVHLGASTLCFTVAILLFREQLCGWCSVSLMKQRGCFFLFQPWAALSAKLLLSFPSALSRSFVAASWAVDQGHNLTKLHKSR